MAGGSLPYLPPAPHILTSFPSSLPFTTCHCLPCLRHLLHLFNTLPLPSYTCLLLGWRKKRRGRGRAGGGRAGAGLPHCLPLAPSFFHYCMGRKMREGGEGRAEEHLYLEDTTCLLSTSLPASSLLCIFLLPLLHCARLLCLLWPPPHTPAGIWCGRAHHVVPPLLLPHLCAFAFCTFRKGGGRKNRKGLEGRLPHASLRAYILSLAFCARIFSPHSPAGRAGEHLTASFLLATCHCRACAQGVHSHLTHACFGTAYLAEGGHATCTCTRGVFASSHLSALSAPRCTSYFSSLSCHTIFAAGGHLIFLSASPRRASSASYRASHCAFWEEEEGGGRWWVGLPALCTLPLPHLPAGSFFLFALLTPYSLSLALHTCPLALCLFSHLPAWHLFLHMSSLAFWRRKEAPSSFALQAAPSSSLPRLHPASPPARLALIFSPLAITSCLLPASICLGWRQKTCRASPPLSSLLPHACLPSLLSAFA